MHFEYDVAAGVYKIYRYGFAFITDNFYLGTVDGTNIISAAPVASGSAPIANKQELVAAICAAIAEDLGTEASNIRVVSFKKI